MQTTSVWLRTTASEMFSSQKGAITGLRSSSQLNQKPKKKRKQLADYPFRAIQAKVDRLCGEIRKPKAPKLEKVKRLYARRKRNGKQQRWEKIYKTYPPRDPYRAWQD